MALVDFRELIFQKSNSDRSDYSRDHMQQPQQQNYMLPKRRERKFEEAKETRTGSNGSNKKGIVQRVFGTVKSIFKGHQNVKDDEDEDDVE